MSDSEGKTDDKKEIEDEEREKMLNEENKKDSEEMKTDESDEVKVMIEPKKEEGEVMKMRKALEESEKEKEKEGKLKIPIGGIKIPGFLRSRSREKAKEEDLEEDKDLLQEPACIVTNVHEKTDKDHTSGGNSSEARKKLQLGSIVIKNPFAKKAQDRSDGKISEEGDQTSEGKRARILNAIRLPIVTELSRKFKHKDKDPEIGTAGLASMETLDDSTDMKSPDDGMENVKLDNTEEKAQTETEDRPINQAEQMFRQYITIFRRSRIMICVLISVIIFMLALLVILLSLRGNAQPVARPVISGRYIETITSCGRVRGLLDQEIFIFRGIPYAPPPVAEKRFLASNVHDNITSCWNGTYMAFNSTTCLQFLPNDTITGVENCLTLDIYTPSVSYENPVPVVVLISADTMTSGSLESLKISPKIVKGRNVVYVVPNFRLAALGFLASSALTRSVHPPTSGNYGLTDIIAALKWVSLNIQHFNGDKNAVTVLGHRAGGTMVTALTASYPARSLFQRAWISSAASIFPGRELREAEKDFESYVESLNCGTDSVVECLRNLPAKKIMERIPEDWKEPKADLPFDEIPQSHTWLVQDGYVLRNHVQDAWQQDNSSSIQIVMGSTSHSDIPHHLLADMTTDTYYKIEQHVRKSLLGKKGLSDEALRRYSKTLEGLISMISDIRTVCPLLNLSRVRSNVPFYIVTQTRKNGELLLADVESDMDAILSQCKHNDSNYLQFCRKMQDIFYRFVESGNVRKTKVENQGLIFVDHNVNPSHYYPNCDSWFSHEIVPKYSRIE